MRSTCILFAALTISCGGSIPSLNYPPAFQDYDGLSSYEGAAAPILNELWEANVERESSQKLVQFSSAILLTWFQALRMTTTPGSQVIPHAPCIERSEEELPNGHVRVHITARECRIATSRGDRIYDGELTSESWGDALVVTTPGWSTEEPSLLCRDAIGEPLRVRNAFRGLAATDGSWFALDVVWDVPLRDCGPPQTTAIRYEGHTEEQQTRYVTRGRGRVGNAHSGVAWVESDQVGSLNECEFESLTGWTRVESRGHTTEVRYDGARECTSPASAPLFVDGVERGTVPFGCALSPHGRGWPWIFLALLVLRRKVFRSAE